MGLWEQYLKENESRFLNELIEFLRIPSISALSEYSQDVRDAGRWVADRLEAAGLENVQILETGGHPAVYADWLNAPGMPTVMIYGHFDVQPVDPLNLWSHPPFEPVVKDERIYARGASDNKGNMLIPIIAAEALLQSEGGLPVNVKFFFEGQEEIGSPQMPEAIPRHKALLACDVIISADGGQWEEDQPALLIGLRGICAIQINVQATKADVHSGSYGGAFLNPIHALVQIIDSMRSADGKILVEGFYDDVRPLSKAERLQMEKIPFDEMSFKNQLGVSELFGEPGYTTYERLWTRPTLDVNGIWGGFQGEGLKTVIPREAHAKISCRLVADQDPEKITQLLIAHVNSHAPRQVKVSANAISSRAKPYLIPADHPGNEAARVVLKTLYGKEPYYARLGGTIPVCSMLLDTLGAYTVNFAFGLKDENIHAPDEFFRLSSFRLGQKAYVMLLGELSGRKF
ncbi:MAG: dipeptidase [Deltaproteobacteria bacterium]|nr:dipeptidase [Deltaproteobacteria bacterium]